jgi:hypothetical protein
VQQGARRPQSEYREQACGRCAGDRRARSERELRRNETPSDCRRMCHRARARRLVTGRRTEDAIAELARYAFVRVYS